MFDTAMQRIKTILLIAILVAGLKTNCQSQAVYLTFQTQTFYDTIKVSWITESETDVDYFILQRSFYGSLSFTDLDTINAVGNSTTNQFYFYNDIPPMFDTCYFYRIKEVESNGQFIFTPVITGCVFLPLSVTELKQKNEITIYPNPSSGNFAIGFKNKAATGLIQILNQLGEPVYYSKISHESTIPINLKGVAPGNYFIRLLDGNNISNRKLIIVKE